MPKIWSETITAHRAAVRDATLDTTAQLVAEHGLTSVTMSQIAERTGIGRATLYKYFPDVDAIVIAWHERQIHAHLSHLAQVRDRIADPRKRLDAVLEAYALMQHEHLGTELGALLHQGPHVVHAQRHLSGLVRGLLADAAESGDLRNDVSPDELTVYCMRALTAAVELPTKAAVRRLVAVTLDGLRWQP